MAKIDTGAWRIPPKGKFRIIEYNKLDGSEEVVGDVSASVEATECAKETIKGWFGSEKRTKEINIYDDTGHRCFNLEPKNPDLIPVINL